MSGFIGAAQPQNLIGNEDLRLNRMDWQPTREFADIWWDVAPFTTDWWPGGANFMGAGATDVGMFYDVQWGQYDQAAGASSRFGLTGVTRDQWGTPVPSCTVKLYRTSNDALLDTQVSDATTGAFLLSTPYYPDQHYIVAHKTGSPDIDGVTPNTLVGT